MHDKTCECTTHAAKSEFWRRLVFDNEDGRCYYKYRTSSAVSERFKQEEKAPKRLLSGMEPFSSYKLAKRSRLPNTRRKSKKANNQTPLQIDVLHFTLVLPSISLVAANVLILE